MEHRRTTDDAPMDVVQLKRGDIVQGHRIEAKLGEGQMGEVFAATSPAGQRVAIKFLRFVGNDEEQLRGRFRREAALSSRLRHPNLVRVESHGVENGVPFLVMEMLRGSDLDTWLERCGPLAPELACTIAVQAARGIGAAHEAGIIHRDIKPANVFVDEQDDGTFRIVVCDFGLAKVFDEDGALTASGMILGTPLYMAPEQLLAPKRVDARCDVWALGMILYHALAGRPAFADLRGMGDLVVALGENHVPPVQTFAPWISPALARAVHASLLPRDQRYGRIEELLHALRAWGPDPAAPRLDAIVPLAAERRMHVGTRATLPQNARDLGTPDEHTVATGPVLSPQAKSTPPPDGFIGMLVADRYRVVSKLGSGGMGRVYIARDERASAGAPSEVAVKVLAAADVTGDGARRLLREAKAAARIDNPHVTKVFAWGIEPSVGAPYLVMELLRGMDLAEVLEHHRPLEPETAVALALQAAEGLRAAHAMGVIHRDIKPSNLFLHEEEDGTVILKVCDFGIAKQLAHDDAGSASTELTRTGGLLGSPIYMSPEQARSAKSVDERSDVYSLSLTLHEMLCGQKPWPGRTAMGELILAICTEDVPSLYDVAPWTPPAIVDAIARGVARNLNERHATVSELARSIAPFAARERLSLRAIPTLSPDRRSQVHSRPQPMLPALPTTADGVSIAERPPAVTRGRARLAAIAALAIVVSAVLGVGATMVTNRPPTPAAMPLAPAEAPLTPPSALPAVSVPTTSTSSANGIAPSTPTASTIVSAAPSSARAAPVRRPNGVAAGPSGAPRGTASSPKAATSTTSPFLGRGATATELPP